ncbi:MAG TPA: PEP/pyruvate-binding domain-containing protein [Candidatus Deferrimicrobiaceae bacterium]|jgi:hypothetical protein
MAGTKARCPGTGLPSLDAVLDGLRLGDNVVWQVDAVEEYVPFVDAFRVSTLAAGRPLIYFRFARHAELLPPGCGVERHVLNPEVGFETFTAEIHRVIAQAGPGAYYVFDSLSDLAADWYSDLMLGNFFMVTCPFLYELDTVTYFALLRDRHSFEAVAAIRDTTQILVDVFRQGDDRYVHPLKVDGRHSPTMYLPHRRRGEDFLPVTESAFLAEVLAGTSGRRVDTAARGLDMWDRTVLEARKALDEVGRGIAPAEEAGRIFRRLLRMLVSRDDRVIALAEKWLDLTDLLAIRKRMLGTGLIGGKSVGMLLSRAILAKSDACWADRLETHDSFFVGSDVFYTYLVRNGCWKARRTQREAGGYLEGAEEARGRILAGAFPPFVREQFIAMLEYFGQSPIIVRSSSFLEDGFGNAFTGKYESVFCPNQGTPEGRLAAFLDAVRTVYASTMSEEALLYRAHRGLLGRDEQMAVLVQRVSGAVHGHLFYPQVAGVGLSFNPYVWSEGIDPAAGVVRLVFGLGTRAVDRSDDDYTRIVALNDPLRRPDSGGADRLDHAQRRVDVIDLDKNAMAALHIDEVVRVSPSLPIETFAVRRDRLLGRSGEVAGPASWVLTFDRLLSETPLVPQMREMLSTLHRAYDYPVDVEFTANLLSDGRWRIDPVQCRPLQVKEGGVHVPPPEGLRDEDIVLATRGPVIGQSSIAAIDRLIIVDPDRYAALPIPMRYEVARAIGRLVHLPADPAPVLMLVGPGRWGTSTPSLGVPVSFGEISAVSVICEVVAMGGGVVPDVSLGSHFFNDLVEADMLYLALFPGRAGNVILPSAPGGAANRLGALLPDDADLSDVIRVTDFPLADGRVLYVNADSPRQRAVSYLSPCTP